MFEKALKSDADYIFLDLEDAVSPNDKVIARENVIQALKELDWKKNGKTISVRIKSSITFTEKTKFIFAINKGIASQIREKPYDVNNFISENERRIPFENMIYLGDGPSDIPCFSMIEKLGGTSIAIDSKDEWSKNWEYELRSRKMDSFKPDYSESGELRKKLESILQS